MRRSSDTSPPTTERRGGLPGGFAKPPPGRRGGRRGGPPPRAGGGRGSVRCGMRGGGGGGRGRSLRGRLGRSHVRAVLLRRRRPDQRAERLEKLHARGERRKLGLVVRRAQVREPHVESGEDRI